MKNRAWLWIPCALALAACADGAPWTSKTGIPLAPRGIEPKLFPTASCEGLLDAMRADAEAKVRDEAWRLLQSYDLHRDYEYSGGADAAAPLAPADASSDGPSRFTDTNTQEAGVDEPDFVKTDGERIFLLHGDDLQVFDSWPAAETALVGAADIEGSPISMFLAGDQLVVFSSVYFERPGEPGSDAPPGIARCDVA